MGNKFDKNKMTLENPEVNFVTRISYNNGIDEKADAALYTGGEDTGLPSVRYTDTTWCLLFNTQNAMLSNLSLRQALAQAAYSADLPPAEGLETAGGLIPPAVTVGSQSYRDAVGSALPASQNAAALCQNALTELGVSSVRGLTVLLPEGCPAADAFASLNQLWQSQLGLYINVQQLPMEELLSAQSSGDYAIMLLPLSSAENAPHALLRQFGDGGLCRWVSAEFQARAAALSPAASGYAQDCAALERELLNEAVLAHQFFHTAAAAQLFTDIMAQCTDIRTFRAMYPHGNQRQLNLQNIN